ncbi:phosphotransferase [Paenibacillus sp. GP183]|uniref:phosphotransferase n=1 Tax=Paenibacillus sp. GP183 TaxID=1882751 RepID=UPI00089B645B|nr:phosphotransferase [Paenibacillus sp. GP183]SEC27961.1 Ser/Thr protein kinase RdoA involved in Cpx stress response, MazF antagonist [Paenibacillus sp. GP183]
MKNRHHYAIFKHITTQYGLRLRRIKSFDSMYKKNVVYRASTNKGKFLIKAFSNRISDGRRFSKAKLVSNIKKLKKSHYPYIGRFLTTKSGRYYVNTNKKSYYMMEWVKGHPMQKDPNHYEKLGKALANLHTSYKDSHDSVSSFTKRQIKCFEIESRLFQLRLKLIKKMKATSSRWFKEHGKQCIGLANEAWEIIKKPEVQHVLSEEKKHPALIHGDVTIPNIVVHSSKLFLIDWDSLRKGSAYYEIAKTLSNTAGYKPELLEALLQGYEKIKRLSPGERLLISALFRFPREAWNEARNLAYGRKTRGFDILKGSWNDRLDCIKKLDQWAYSSSPSP